MGMMYPSGEAVYLGWDCCVCEQGQAVVHQAVTGCLSVRSWVQSCHFFAGLKSLVRRDIFFIINQGSYLFCLIYFLSVWTKLCLAVGHFNSRFL